MAFVKLDVCMLDSTIWIDREARELFITALLLAEPMEIREPMPQIEVRSLKETGFVVPVGWYGFVPAAGVGIIRRALVDQESGYAALERLCAPDTESRSPEFEGRRLVRVDGGYIVLNFIKYRERDHTTAERSRRYRERLKSRRSGNTVTRDITQAEAEAEAEAPKTIPPVLSEPDILLKQVKRVWDYYVKKFNRKPTYTFTDKRKAKGLARLLDCQKLSGGDSEKSALMLKMAVDNLYASEFHRAGGYIDWVDNLFKSTEQLQKWLDPQKTKAATAGESSAMKSWAETKRERGN